MAGRQKRQPRPTVYALWKSRSFPVIGPDPVVYATDAAGSRQGAVGSSGLVVTSNGLPAAGATPPVRLRRCRRGAARRPLARSVSRRAVRASASATQAVSMRAPGSRSRVDSWREVAGGDARLRGAGLRRPPGSGRTAVAGEQSARSMPTGWDVTMGPWGVGTAWAEAHARDGRHAMRSSAAFALVLPREHAARPRGRRAAGRGPA